MSKSKHNPNEVQLSLFDLLDKPKVQTLSIPLELAREFGFRLDYKEIDGNPENHLFHAGQWVAGLTDGATDSRRIWSRIKSKIAKRLDNGTVPNREQLKTVKLPHLATNNKTYEVDFVSEQYAYLIVQEIPESHENPQLSAMKDYLSRAGAEIAWQYNNPEQDTNRALDREIKILVSSRGMTPEQARKHALRRQSGRIARNLATDKLKFHVIDTINYATFTDKAEYQPLFNRLAAEICQMTGVTDARDGMTTEALAFLEIAELTFARRIEAQGSITFQEACELMVSITAPLGLSIQAMERITGVDMATGQKLLKSHYDWE